MLSTRNAKERHVSVERFALPKLSLSDAGAAISSDAFPISQQAELIFSCALPTSTGYDSPEPHQDSQRVPALPVNTFHSPHDPTLAHLGVTGEAGAVSIYGSAALKLIHPPL